MDTQLLDGRRTNGLWTHGISAVADPLDFSTKSKPRVVCTFPLKPNVATGSCLYYLSL